MSKAGGNYLQTIVDDGGTDELQYESQTDGAKIDLRPGQWNELGKQITYTHGGRQRRDGNVILYQDANAENPFDSLIENATGGEGPDEITGNDAANVLRGNGGADTLQGGLGIDTLDGGSGFDTVLYRDAPYAVSVDLSTGKADGGEGSDTLISIEKVVGSPFADTLIGSDGDDVLDGRQGDDTLEGSQGKDLLIGRGGTDTASYATSKAGVKVSLAITTEQETGGAGTDTLQAVENLIGSAIADELVGDGGPNLLVGGEGSDTLRGKAGKDTFGYETPSDGKDIIRDFGGTERDQIAIFSPNFGPVASLSSGTLPSRNFVAAKEANLDQRQLEKPNAYFLFNTTNDTLYFDSDGAGTQSPRVALAEIKFVTTGDKLSNTDIVLTTSLT